MRVNGFSLEEITDGPKEGFYEECASGRDFIPVKTHFPMRVNCIRWDLCHNYIGTNENNVHGAVFVHNIRTNEMKMQNA